MAGPRSKWIAAAGLLVFAAGCAGARDLLFGPGPKRFVRPGADGVHEIRIRSAEKADAEQLALRGAKDYCRDLRQQAVFIDQSVEYTGTLDEQTRAAVRQAARAAGAVGWGRGDRMGRVLGDIESAGQTFTGGEDYRADASFRCQ